ncbi:MAG: hypothetical protein QOF01_5263 [Thermomicrobiales bacterium]|jgi:hypothetical protein|nr:hypothetical protein [Thermomicrobiales bacterium]MEA2525806.1 hypothetical protein [Thermomicrobiales bacterium]MEA2598794.1 hypothetical protein [Thermomicrobiales bacterium]
MTSRAPVDHIVKATHVRRRTADAAARSAAELGPHPLVKLQRQVGNATIARTLAQREGAPEEEEIMAKHDHDTSHATPEVGLEGGPISGELSGRIDAKRGSGTTLDAGTRTNMESAFGDRFDDVRIHTDDEADSLNRSVSAKAFTTGTDIFFSRNASPSDSNLLAHELAHVVQQRSTSSSGGPMTVGPANDGHEHAADAAASTIASGASASAQRLVESPEAIAREAAPEEEELMG